MKCLLKLKKLLLLVLFSFYITGLGHSEGNLQESACLRENLKEQFIKDSYEYCIPIIKKWERYRAKKYYLFDSYYIGYGHRMLPSDTLSNLTELQADSLLRIDFNKKIAAVRKRLKNLPDHRIFVIACLFYNCKSTSIINSSLWPDLVKGKTDIEKKFKSFVYINGKPSKKMLIRRCEEYELWCKRF